MIKWCLQIAPGGFAGGLGDTFVPCAPWSWWSWPWLDAAAQPRATPARRQGPWCPAGEESNALAMVHHVTSSFSGLSYVISYVNFINRYHTLWHVFAPRRFQFWSASPCWDKPMICMRCFLHLGSALRTHPATYRRSIWSEGELMTKRGNSSSEVSCKTM